MIEREDAGLPWIIRLAGFHLVLAIALTWPLSLHLASATPSRWGDSKISTWVMAWDAHALATQPASLFQAPIFHPEPDALAYTDHLLGVGLFSAPIMWAGGNIYLAHNIVFVLSIAFAGFAASLAATELTGSRSAGLIGGVAYQASPYWFGPIVNTSHIQIIASGWIPMACFALLRWWRTEHSRHLVLLTVSFVMASLTTWHQTTFLSVILAILVVGLLLAPRAGNILRLATRGFLAAVVAALILVPFARPYFRIERRDPNYTRTLGQVSGLSAHPSSFLAAPSTNLLYGSLTASFRERNASVETDLFPGTLIVVLAGIGMASSIRRGGGTRAVTIAFALVAVVGVVLSMGTAPAGFRHYLPWAWLSRHTPAFRAIRTAARANMITVLGLAMLAATGAAAVLRRATKRRGFMVSALIAILVVEGWSVPLRLGDAPKPEPALSAIASRPGTVLELPTAFPHGGLDSQVKLVKRMMDQTVYWRPLVDGLGGYIPPGFARLIGALPGLPDPNAMAMLHRYEVRTLIIRRSLVEGTPWANLEAKLEHRTDFRLLFRANDIVVYDVAP